MYFKTIATNQNCIQEENKNVLNSGNVCYHAAQSLLSFRFLSKNLKIKICKTVILSAAFYGSWKLVLSH
jgi:hypothetical protein